MLECFTRYPQQTKPPAPVPPSPPDVSPPAQTSGALLAAGYIGTCSFRGTRKDGVPRSGSMEFAFNGAVAYTIIDRDLPNGYTSTGRWGVELRGGKVYLTLSSIKGKTWKGYASGSVKEFTLSKTAHGTYTSTKIR